MKRLLAPEPEEEKELATKRERIEEFFGALLFVIVALGFLSIAIFW